MIADYFYHATIIDVIDGDTVKLEVDLGFHMRYQLRGRLASINAPEGKDTEAARYLKGRLSIGEKVIIKTSKYTEKYGRWLVTIWKLNEDREVGIFSDSINQELVGYSFAFVWPLEGDSVKDA